MSTAGLVPLQPDSLYVATQTVLAPDGRSIQAHLWHWCFFITDTRGHTVQHHWTVRGGQRGVTTECYQYRDVREVSCATARSYYAVFAKIGSWAHPGARTLKAALDALYKNYEGIPSDSLRSHPDGLRSCRTWVMDALLMFVANRWLVPCDHSLPARYWLHTAVHDSIMRTSLAVTAALLKDGPMGFRSTMLEIPTSS